MRERRLRMTIFQIYHLTKNSCHPRWRMVERTYRCLHSLPRLGGTTAGGGGCNTKRRFSGLGKTSPSFCRWFLGLVIMHLKTTTNEQGAGAGRADTRTSELVVRQSWSQETNYARVSQVKCAHNVSHKLSSCQMKSTNTIST